MTQWVADGGGFIGIGEPSAVADNMWGFQLAPVLDVDKDRGNSRLLSTTASNGTW